MSVFIGALIGCTGYDYEIRFKLYSLISKGEGDCMSEAHWYVVHTYSGYENKVKVDIEKTIENRNLQDQILEVSVPMLPVVELKNGVEKKPTRKCFRVMC